MCRRPGRASARLEYTDIESNTLPIHMFLGMGAIICRSFGVAGGKLLEAPLSRWVPDGYYRTHSLEMRGDAGLGKTPLAMSMLSEATDIL